MSEKTELSPTRVLRFGVFQVNLAARELRKHGVRIRLPGQPFCVLSILLERPGQVLSREEMRDKLWSSDTFVDYERSLNSAIRKLRAVLGDSQESPRYIETVPRLGYRFIAPVNMVDTGAPPAGASASMGAGPWYGSALCRIIAWRCSCPSSRLPLIVVRKPHDLSEPARGNRFVPRP